MGRSYIESLQRHSRTNTCSIWPLVYTEFSNQSVPNYSTRIIGRLPGVSMVHAEFSNQSVPNCNTRIIRRLTDAALVYA